MRFHSLVIASFVAAAYMTFAPSVRADSFFVTFTNGTRTLGARVQGAVFEGSSTPVTAGKATPVRLEIDDWSIVQPTLDAANGALPLTAKVEFTTPNAQGQEVVYLIATYQKAALIRVAGTYDAAATAKVKEAIDFTYATMQYSAPPLALGVVSTERRLPSTAPVIRRTARAIASAQRVDDAYFQAASFPGESSDHPGQTRLLGFSFEGRRAVMGVTGQAEGPLVLSPVTITKTPGAATATFQSAAATRKVVDAATITFVQHHGTSPDTTSKTVLLSYAVVKSDTVQAGAANVESITLMPTSFRLTAGTSTTEVLGAGPSR